MRMWEMTASVFMGGLAALLVHDWILASAAEYATKEAMKQFESTTRALTRMAPPIAPPSLTNRSDEAAQQAAQRQRELNEEARLNAEGKEATFQRRFRASPKCQVDPSTMDCANEYLRARKAFDAAWHNQTSSSGPVTLPR